MLAVPAHATNTAVTVSDIFSNCFLWRSLSLSWMLLSGVYCAPIVHSSYNFTKANNDKWYDEQKNCYEDYMR